MDYSFLTWMGATEWSLKQLDRVQHQALRLIGTGVVLPHLSHQRMVGALCYMYKLHCNPSSHPVTSLLPGPAVAAQIHEHGGLQSPAVGTSSSTTNLGVRLHGIHGDSLAPPRRHGMCYCHLLQHKPELKRMQVFFNKINCHLLNSNWLAATDSL